jgi:DnaJ-class molecular chaperone
MPRKLLFENVTCSRCGGTGSYSWCQMYGSTCFKCAGSGSTLTKRGHAAQVWLNARKKVPTTSINVGDRVWSESVFGNLKMTVVEITPNERGGMDIVGETEKGERSSLIGFTEVRRVLTNGQMAELKAGALAFQATLTKAGTVSKRSLTTRE